MNLLKVKKSLETFVKRIKRQTDFEELRSYPFYAKFEKNIKQALKDQSKDFIEYGFNGISTLKKYGSKDSDNTLRFEVAYNLEPLVMYVDVNVFDVALYEFANKGGQLYLDKMGINEKFILRNDALIQRLKTKRDMLIGKINPLTGKIMGRGLLDESTMDYITGVLTRAEFDGLSVYETKGLLTEGIKGLSEVRAEMIAETEIAAAVGNMEMEAAKRNGSTKKRWMIGGSNICEECMANAKQGWIPMNADYQSGVQHEPQHPRCKCVQEYSDPMFTDNYWLGN